MTRPESPQGSGGFTLLELLVALAVSGIVLMTAHGILAQTGDAAALLALESRREMRQANAEDYLRRLVRSHDTSIDPGDRFLGTQQIARFPTWCETAFAWTERCVVTLAVLGSETSYRLVLERSDQRILLIREAQGPGSIDYLADAGEGGTWVGTWAESLASPLAIRVVMGRDTLLLPIGERG